MTVDTIKEYYYSEDGTIFTGKISAIRYCQTNTQKLYFYYHDDVYSKYDWTVEPAGSLDYYYLEQAKRIRDLYDRVILCYSGGYDSSNILETFHFNGLKLDKIVTVGAFSQDSRHGVDENHNGEIYHNAWPYLKELGLESITQTIDYSKMFDKIDNFTISQYGSDWVDYTGGWFSPHNWFWRDLERHIVPSEWKELKVAIIFGRDKPTLFPSPTDNRPSRFCFRDTPVNSYGNSGGFENQHRINFYWDPDFPQILIKQLHVLKKACQTEFKLGYDKTQGVNTFSGISTNQLIYNLRRPLFFKSLKSNTGRLSLRDAFFINKKNSEIYDFYSSGITLIDQIAAIGRSPIDPAANGRLPVIQSKFYNL